MKSAKTIIFDLNNIKPTKQDIQKIKELFAKNKDKQAFDIYDELIKHCSSDLENSYVTYKNRYNKNKRKSLTPAYSESDEKEQEVNIYNLLQLLTEVKMDLFAPPIGETLKSLLSKLYKSLTKNPYVKPFLILMVSISLIGLMFRSYQQNKPTKYIAYIQFNGNIIENPEVTYRDKLVKHFDSKGGAVLDKIKGEDFFEVGLNDKCYICKIDYRDGKKNTFYLNYQDRCKLKKNKS